MRLLKPTEAMMLTLKPKKGRHIIFGLLVAALLTIIFGTRTLPGANSSYIVQAADLETAVAAIHAVGGTVTHELGIINSAGAQLTPAQKAKLQADGRVVQISDDSLAQVGVFSTSRTATVGMTADAWLKEKSPNEAYGSVNELPVREVVGDRYRAIYQPDLSQIPPNALITSATLNVWVTQQNRGTVNAYPVTSAWSESTATWATVAQAYNSSMSVGFKPSKSSRYYGVDVTGWVQNWVDGSMPNYGLMFISATKDEYKFTSREWSTSNQRPFLTVSYILIPSAADAPRVAEASSLHFQGNTAADVTVAIIDTGFWNHPLLSRNSAGQQRLVAQYDAITNQVLNVQNGGVTNDEHGHGTHVTSVLANSFSLNDKFFSVAPDVRLVSVKAFGANGAGTYADIIRGLDWVVANKSTYNIRVLNLSFSGVPQSYYWEDPLNQAVMRAWNAGIVVVTTAGNAGPNPMTIGVPGNVPYVITVGALSDNYTPFDPRDDFLGTFSSAGPTVEGFVKPEVLAPGGHVAGLMPATSALAQTYPQFFVASDYFALTGTSQATAVTSGVVAQMLKANPSLTPDNVKCRLMASARIALNENGVPAYSVFQQGAGLISASAAVASNASGCANVGLNIGQDMNSSIHFGGPANYNPNTGEYYIVGDDGLAWNGSYIWSGSYVWSSSFVWSGSYVWSSATFSSSSYVWSSSYIWSGSYVWSSAHVNVNQWVPQE